jgi:hypothetical protein
MQRQESNYSEDVKGYTAPAAAQRKKNWKDGNAADAHAQVMAEYLAESVRTSSCFDHQQSCAYSTSYFTGS